MMHRKWGVRLGNRIKVVADYLDAGLTDHARQNIEVLTFKIPPASVEYYQGAIDAVINNKDDPEMLRTISDGLKEHALRKGGNNV